MLAEPKVTVITRTKNRPLLLRRAIQSVSSQTYKNWEMQIVNDGGEASVVNSLVAEFPSFKSNIKVIHHEHSLGMEAASNSGIRQTNGDLLVIHDDDDSWANTFLEKCVEYMVAPDNHHVGGVVTRSRLIKETLESDSVDQVSEEVFNPGLRAISFFRIAQSNQFPPISFVFKRSALDKVGAFREDLPVLGDWDFNLRVLQAYEVGFLPEVLANWHHRVNVLSGPMSNSVIGGNSMHEKYDFRLRSEWLRKDVQAGAFGIGTIANVGRELEELNLRIQRIEDANKPLYLVSKVLRKIRARFRKLYS